MATEYKSARGRFITVEGGEGVGKTTNIAFIVSTLQQQGLSVISTREPGGTHLAEEIRQLLIGKRAEPIDQTTELLLMFAARAQHLKTLIEPALASGQWVVCDRFTDATYAYQGGGRGIDCDKIELLENLVQGELRPDLVLLLDLDIETGMTRAKNRGELDRFESEKMAFFKRVRETYLTRASSNSQRYKIIDGSQSISEVQIQIQTCLDILMSEQIK